MVARVLAVWIGCLALGLAITAGTTIKTVRAQPHGQLGHQDVQRLRRPRVRWAGQAGLMLAVISSAHTGQHIGWWVLPVAVAAFFAALEIPRLLHNAAVRRRTPAYCA